MSIFIMGAATCGIVKKAASDPGEGNFSTIFVFKFVEATLAATVT